MTVKDVLKATCAMVNREDVLDYLNDKNTVPSEDTLSAVNIMTALSNLVIGELAGTFIPMVKSERVVTTDKKVKYADLSERCLRILAVYNDKNEKIFYRHTPEYMIVDENSVTVEYEFNPPNYSLEDEIGYSEEDISTATLSYGLAAEYSISRGSFDEAVMWHERYVDSVSAKRKIKNSTIKSRSFV